MAKLKSNRSISKRFTKTGGSKLKRTHGFKNHILTKKSSKRKNHLAKTGYVRARIASKLRHVLAK